MTSIGYPSCALPQIPLPLVPEVSFLHEQPAVSSRSSSLRSHSFLHDASSTPRPGTRRLRRVPASQHNLKASCEPVRPRAISHATAPARSRQTWYPHNTSDSKAESYVTLRAAKHTRRTERPAYNCYQDMHILSMYGVEDLKHQTVSDKRIPQWVETTIMEEIAETRALGEEIFSQPRIPAEDSDEEEERSPESSWLANESSHEERQRRFNARCCQVLEYGSNRHKAAEDTSIMVATMVVGPGKPKLVQISRPLSSHTLARADSGHALPTPDLHQPPSTPDRDRNEVSVFSPDTSGCETPITDLSSSGFHEAFLKKERPQLTVRTTNLSAVPERSSSLHRATGGTHTGDTAETFKTTKLADPFDSSPSAKSSCSSYSDSEQEDFVPPQHREPELRQDTLCQKPIIKRSTSGPRKYQLAKMLTAATKALDALTERRFHMQAAELQPFQSGFPLRDAKLLKTLGSIFTTADPFALSQLAAWVVVNHYFTDVIESPVEDVNLMGREGVKHSILPRAKGEWSPTVASDAYWNSIATLETEQPRPMPIVVPSKAQQVLGLGFQSPMSTVPLPRSTIAELARLEDRAHFVHDSIQVVGRKLVGDLVGDQAATHLWDAAKVVARFVLSRV